jgi:hypothetical protein
MGAKTLRGLSKIGSISIKNKRLKVAILVELYLL